MELYLNELSINSGVDYKALEVLVEVYKELSKVDITTCRIDISDYTKLLQVTEGIFNVHNFFFAFFKPPYEAEMDELKQDEYYEHEWCYGGEKCVGIALAYILNTLTFSIYSLEWDRAEIEFTLDEEQKNIRNICSVPHVALHIKNEEELSLVKCEMEAADKEIVLRDDHGIDTLMAFSKRLVKNPYVIKVLNSLPHNPHQRKFIRSVRENGLIEIVLPWTDKGIGVVIQTTGRNIRETTKIAQIIEEDYGYL